MPTYPLPAIFYLRTFAAYLNLIHLFVQLHLRLHTPHSVSSWATFGEETDLCKTHRDWARCQPHLCATKQMAADLARTRTGQNTPGGKKSRRTHFVFCAPLLLNQTSSPNLWLVLFDLISLFVMGTLTGLPSGLFVPPDLSSIVMHRQDPTRGGGHG
jgi:hypothetical protein